MPYPARKRSVYEGDQAVDGAIRVHSYFEQVVNMLDIAAQQVAVDRFDKLVEIPDFNRKLQANMVNIKARNLDQQIIEETNRIYGASTSMAEIDAFFSALDDLASRISANSGVFEMTFNPETGKPEYVTPVSPAIKSAIQTRLSDALALVD